ncbi:hypothetical protein VTN00DRAFT_3510 [Thermoascus crustaceus]|uniref:uncharacterized protein n=1 Tax=Thermoascus crustaceus TaxID=5088 RepID=UPI0037424485
MDCARSRRRSITAQWASAHHCEHVKHAEHISGAYKKPAWPSVRRDDEYGKGGDSNRVLESTPTEMQRNSPPCHPCPVG